MSPSERIEAISRRMHRRGKGRRQRRCYEDLPAVQLAMWRKRRELLESERPDWIAAIERFDGRIGAIALHMGCCPETARDALWDLGLWPEVARRNPYCGLKRARWAA